MKRIFITGTDTGVGKTIVSALLCHHTGFSYIKPIQSGTDTQTDLETIQRLFPKTVTHPEIYRLRQPLSPHLAAPADHLQISMQNILERISAIKMPLLIEGAGGLMVPLNSEDMMIDLIAALEAVPILVARTTLGTINHTLLSLKALREKALQPLGVIFVGNANPESEAAICHFGQTKTLLRIPWLENLSTKTLCNIPIHLEDLPRANL
jgi:dethiobiotin synthase